MSVEASFIRSFVDPSRALHSSTSRQTDLYHRMRSLRLHLVSVKSRDGLLPLPWK